MPRYFARSASDNTDDWPYWFVADSMKGGLNVTATLDRKLKGGHGFLPPWDAVKLSMASNRLIAVP